MVIATFQWATPLAPKRNVSLKNVINNFWSHPKYNQKLLIRFITRTLSFFGKSWSKVVAMALFTGLSNRACFCIWPYNKAFCVENRSNNFWSYLRWLQKLLMSFFKKTFRLGARGWPTGMSHDHWNVARLYKTRCLLIIHAFFQHYSKNSGREKNSVFWTFLPKHSLNLVKFRSILTDLLN